ncbi:MAG: alpha/beta fold hydrolase, partial [Nitrospirae bacterium]
LFLPGLFAGGWIWERVASPLALELQVVVPRHPYALHPRPQASLEGLVAHLERLLERHARAPALLFANSLGGLVALAFARRRPERLAGLVLSGAPGLSEGRAPGIGGRRLTREAAHRLASHLFYDRTAVSDAAVEAAFETIRAPAAQRNIVRLLRESRRAGLTGWLCEVRVPTLLVWGAEDRVTPVGPWTAACRDLPEAELRILRHCGHSPMLERPEAFLRLVRPFLDRLARDREPAAALV